MCGITNYGKISGDELTNWLIDELGFKQSQFQNFIYYRYAPYGSKLVVLSYVDECVYYYTYVELVKWFVNILGKRYHVIFLGSAHWFMLNNISQFKDHSISVDQDRYATSIVAKYQDTVTKEED